MILGSSKDPVYVKKVYLKIWTLRSEIEEVINSSESKSAEDVEKLKKEYSYKGPLKSESGLKLIEGGAEESTESAESEDLAAKSSDDEEESTEADLPDAKSEPIQIIQRGSRSIPEHHIHNGVCVLSELTMDTLFFFTSKKFLEGQSIVIEFQVPKKFVVNLEVQYCRPFNIKSRIISENKLSCRVAAKFTFLKAGERTLLRKFIESIEPEIPEVTEVPTQAKEEDEGFDGLDGLDF